MPILNDDGTIRCDPDEEPPTRPPTPKEELEAVEHMIFAVDDQLHELFLQLARLSQLMELIKAQQARLKA